ncbi:MAG: agmatinase [Desulfobacterales bacterium]
MIELSLPPWFLESELGRRPPGDCRFHVIPVAFEQSVTYGTGTAAGPAAILEASQQLEVFDGISIPGEAGIFTQAPLICGEDAEQAMLEISAAVARALQMGKTPVMLGGEHTVTVGALHALLEQQDPVGIVQFDAHADLRDVYEGSPLSHACVMRRAVDMGFAIFQIGVRSLSPEESAFREARGIPHLDARDYFRNGFPVPLLPPGFPDTIYLTIDVDGLDPSVISATGTPEPGGLGWYDMMDALEIVCRGRRVLGFDVVELAPVTGHHASDFAAARLVYNTMGVVSRCGED